MKNFKVKLFVVVVLIGLFVLIKFSVSSSHENELIVGTCAGFPPYEILDCQGNVIGFDIDVAQKIADKIGKTLVVKDMSFDALLVALKQGKIDLILAGLSITKARLAEIGMVHYHGKPLTCLPILFWEKIPTGVTCVEDLKLQPNKTVCAQVGTIQEEIIKKYEYIDVKHLENIPDLIMDIKYGKSIAAVLEPMVVAQLQKQLPEIKVLNLPLKDDEQDMGNGIGVKKENTKLIAEVEIIIKQLKDDGTLKALENKWFNVGVANVG